MLGQYHGYRASSSSKIENVMKGLPMIKYLSWVILLSPLACKTTSRGEFSNDMTSISIKLPEEFKAYESQLSLSRTDSKADPKIIKGQDIQLRLPKGEYNLELSLKNKDGVEVYQLCDNSRTRKFFADSEEPVLDLCSRPDMRFVAKTLVTQIVLPIPPPVGPVGPVEPPVVIPPVEPPVEPIIPTEPVDDTPLFVQEASCFGLDTIFSREGDELVIKTAKSIVDYNIDNGNFPRCKITINVKKEVGKAYQPMSYSTKFSGNEATLAQNLFLTVVGKDEATQTAMPCKTTILSTTANSGLAYACSFYDFTPTGEQVFTDRNKLAYEKSCKSETKQITFEFVVVGKNGSRIEDLKLPEIRLGVPKTEDCK